MSGGHFGDYDYYKVSQFAYELEEEIQNNNVKDEYYFGHNCSPEVIEYLKEQLPKLRKMAEIMRAVDYLYSGDHGDDSFLLRVEEIEQKYAE